MSNQPLICIHRVTVEQGEQCSSCKKVHGTYLTLEQPVRIVLCFDCLPTVVKTFLPEYASRIDTGLSFIKGMGGSVLGILGRVSKK